MSDLLIRRGYHDVTSTTGAVAFGDLDSIDDSTSVGALTSAFLVFTNNRNNAAGDPTQTSASLQPLELSVYGYLSDVNEITFVRGHSDDARVYFEIWEYVGSGGGDNEFIVRDRSIFTMASSGGITDSGTMANTPDDIDACVPFITGYTDDETATDHTASSVLAYCSSTATVNVERGADGSETEVAVTTVEFTGSNWSVGHGIVTGQTADSGTIALVTAAAGTGGSTFDVGDWDTAAIVAWGHAGDSSNTAIADHYPLLDPGNSGANTDEVDYTFDSSHDGSDDDIIVHVLQHSDLAVTRFSDSSSSAGASNVDITSAGLADITEASALGSSITSGGGTAFARGQRNYRLTSTTNLEHWCHRSGNTMAHSLQVIDWSGVEVTSSPATVTPSAVAISVTVPTASPSVPGASSGTAVAAAADVPAATVTGEATATGSAVAAAADVPAATPSSPGSVSTTAVAASVDVPTATPGVPGSVVAAPVAAAAGVPVATPSGLAVVSALAVDAVAALPTPTAVVAAGAAPSVVAISADVPTATIQAAALVEPAAVAITADVPSSTPAVAAGVSATVVAIVTAVPQPSTVGGANVSPSVVAINTAVPQPTVFNGLLEIIARAWGQFQRKPPDRLHLAHIGRGNRKGFRVVDENWERVSDVFVYDQHPDGDASEVATMEAVAAVWATHAGSDAATLKAAIHAALNALGYRQPDGTPLE